MADEETQTEGEEVKEDAEEVEETEDAPVDDAE